MLPNLGMGPPLYTFQLFDDILGRLGAVQAPHTSPSTYPERALSQQADSRLASSKRLPDSTAQVFESSSLQSLQPPARVSPCPLESPRFGPEVGLLQRSRGKDYRPLISFLGDAGIQRATI